MKRGTSIRVRLTVLFGVTFLVAGLGLVALNYYLVDNELSAFPETGRRQLVEDFGLIPGSDSGFIRVPGEGFDARGGFGELILEDGRTLAQAIEDFESELRAEFLNSILVQSLIALAVVAVIAVAAGWFMSRRALAPVAEIIQTTRGFSETNLSKRVDLHGPEDELKELADTLDDMLDRVEVGYENQRNFSAYASHELRTPLTVMRVEADNLLDSADASEPARAFARTIQGEVDRSETLISQLLAITRSRSGNIDMQSVDLADLVGEVVAAAVKLADRSGIELELTLDDAVTDGDPVLLRSLTRNLVTNGIVHNQSGGKATVGVGTQAGRATLTVENTGAELTSDDVKRIYKPFEQINEDRSSGLGLGLAVVGSIAQVHNATVSAIPRRGGGLITTVQFPSDQ